jgi:hypothetical protein
MDWRFRSAGCPEAPLAGTSQPRTRAALSSQSRLGACAGFQGFLKNLTAQKETVDDGGGDSAVGVKDSRPLLEGFVGSERD